MKKTRRAFGSAVVGGVLAGTAGCLTLVTGETTTFEAQPAGVPKQTASDAGYPFVDQERLKLEQTVSVPVAGDQDVVAINYLTTYERSLDLPFGEQKAGQFAVFSTPQAKVAGKPFNPVKDMSNKELVKQVQGAYEGISIDGEEENRTVSTMGTDAEVSKFAGSADIGGTEVDIYVHITKVKHDGDFVVLVGVHPQAFPDEEQKMLTLMKNVEHPKEL